MMRADWALDRVLVALCPDEGLTLRNLLGLPFALLACVLFVLVWALCALVGGASKC